MDNTYIFIKRNLKLITHLILLFVAFLIFIPNTNALTDISLENLVTTLKETDTYAKYADSDYVLDEDYCDLDVESVIYTYDSSKTSITYTEDTLTISTYVNMQLTLSTCDYLTVCPPTVPYTYNYETDLTLEFTYSDGYLYWDYENSAVYEIYNADYTDVYEEELIKNIVVLFEDDWVKLVAQKAIELRTGEDYDIETAIADTLKLSNDQWEIALNWTYSSDEGSGDYLLYDLIVNYRYGGVFCSFYFLNAIDYFKINLNIPSTDTDEDTSTTTDDNTQNVSDDYADEAAENPKTGNSDIYYFAGFTLIFASLLLSLKLYNTKKYWNI